MMEQWHPLGVVGVISAFNFPVAVWSWNTALALVCGDAGGLEAVGEDPAHRAGLPGAGDRGGPPGRRAGGGVRGAAGRRRRSAQALVDDPRVALLSATGSTRMGRAVAPRVAGRFGRLLLELGGNNAAIVAPSADLDLAVRGIVFAAAGTAGQRCTSLRRVIAHDVDRRRAGRRASPRPTQTLPIGSPLDDGTLVGPLIDAAAYAGFAAALDKARADGGELVIGGERVLADEADGRLLRAARDRADAGADRHRAGRDVRADPVRARPTTTSTRRWPCTTTCRRACRRRSSR